MAATQSPTIDRNIDAATRFLDRVAALPAVERERIGTDSFGKSTHATAMFATADEVTTLKNKDRDGRVSAFLVDAERRVDSMGLSAEVGDLVRAAARAILVQGRPGLEGAIKQLYLPFESVVPLATIVD
jgi:hypothetical protein